MLLLLPCTDQDEMLEAGGLHSKYIQKRCAHVRHHGLLHTMLQAAQRAAESVTSARLGSSLSGTVTSHPPTHAGIHLLATLARHCFSTDVPAGTSVQFVSDDAPCRNGPCTSAHSAASHLGCMASQGVWGGAHGDYDAGPRAVHRGGLPVRGRARGRNLEDQRARAGAGQGAAAHALPPALPAQAAPRGRGRRPCRCGAFLSCTCLCRDVPAALSDLA